MDNRIFVRFRVVVCALASVLLGVSFVSGVEPSCELAVPLTLDGTDRGNGLDAGSTALYCVEVPSVGLLTVEIVSGFEMNIPWVDVVAPWDSGEQPANFLDRSLGRQVLVIRSPGSYLLRVGAVDPGRPLLGFALSTRFFSPERDSEFFSFKDGSDDTEESNNEIVPIILRPADPPAASPASSFEKLMESVAPACAEAGDAARGLMLCARRLAFAAPLEGELDGEGTGEVFTFVLDGARTIRVASDGPVDTFGVLYDAAGHRLLAADDGGDGGGENFAMRASLPPGRYFVRVLGAMRGEGEYRLELSDSEPGVDVP